MCSDKKRQNNCYNCNIIHLWLHLIRHRLTRGDINMTVKSDNITNTVITALLLFDEYEEMKKTYKNILNDADAGLRALIKRYEVLFFRKINLIINYCYKIGKKEAVESKNIYSNKTLFERCAINLLYDKSTHYRNIDIQLSELKKDIEQNVCNDEFKLKRFNDLMELYNDIIFEISKIAFVFGFSSNYQLLYGDLFSLKNTEPSISELCGSKLKFCRKSKHLTQLALSEELLIDRTNISNYERGKNKPPLDVLLKYSEIFNIKLEHLVDDNFSYSEFVKSYF